MEEHQLHQDFTVKLTSLYSKRDTIERILRFAGVNIGSIDLNKAPINVWSSIFVEAGNQKKLLSIVDQAIDEYENDQELPQLKTRLSETNWIEIQTKPTPPNHMLTQLKKLEDELMDGGSEISILQKMSSLTSDAKDLRDVYHNIRMNITRYNRNENRQQNGNMDPRSYDTESNQIVTNIYSIIDKIKRRIS